MYKQGKLQKAKAANLTAQDRQTKLYKYYDPLFQTLGYRFNNLELLREAMTRQSAIEEQLPRAARRNYQRFEFLGDRVLNFFVLRLLIERNLCHDSGTLNDLKIQAIANHGHMQKIGEQLQLHKYINRGSGERTVTEKMYADAVEALLGAIACDSGYNDECIYAVIKRLFSPYLAPALNRRQLIADAEQHQQQQEEDSETSDEYSYDEDSDDYASDDSIDFDELDRVLAQMQRRGYDDEHFEGGAFKFKHTVLNWDLEEILNPLYEARKMQPLPAKFENPYAKGYALGYYDEDDFSSDDDALSACDTYFDKFKQLVLEESRAILAAGYDAYENDRAPYIEMEFRKVREAKNSDNPSVFTMRGKLPRDFDSGTSNIGILLIPQDSDDIELFGLASYRENEVYEDVEFEIKVVVPLDDLDIFDDEICEQEAKWDAYVLGSLVTQQRMYEVCTKKPEIAFDEDIFSGNLDPLPKASRTTKEKYWDILQRLNEPQRVAILRFLNAGSGLQMLQGPPGTGKTTALVALLQILYRQGKRILVCADSNKGVQVIIKRFHALEPNAPITLSGVKRKLDPELEEVFLHTWGENVCGELQENIFLLQQLMIAANKQEDKQERLKIIHNSVPAISDALTKLATKIRRTVPTYYATETWNRIFLFLRNVTLTKLPKRAQNYIDPVVNLLQGVLYRFALASQTGKNQNCSELEKAILEHARLIGSTLSTAGRRSIQEMAEPDIVVIDEGSQAVEPATWIPLSINGLEDKDDLQCLILGDTKQLPPTVISRVAEQKNYGRSLMYRMIEDRKQPYSLLTMQYRMHREIMLLVSQMYYAGRLKMGEGFVPEDLNFPRVLAPCSFINIDTTEDQDGYSFANKKEANYVVEILKYLLARGIDLSRDVGIITFYAGQVKAIKKLTDTNPQLRDVNVSSVDGFQGDERKIIILSFVRANSKRHVGFVGVPERLNVAISRAQSALIMLGCCQVLESRKNDVADLIQRMRKRNLLFGENELQQALNTKPTPQTASGSAPRQAPSDKLQANCRPLEQALSYRFQHSDILRTALTRKSAIEEKLAEAATTDGWREKFLGEHYLKLVLAILLLNKYPGAKEEELHKHEAKIVTNAFLAPIGRNINLHTMVIRGSGETEMSEQMLVDSLRSIIGAVYLDTTNKMQAREIIRNFCARNFWPQQARHTTTKTVTAAVSKPVSKKPETSKAKNKAVVKSEPKHDPRYKTIPCKFFKQGDCRRGQDCEFAHGKAELRRMP